MLLTVSVVSVLIAGLIGYISGTNSLRTAEYQRLTQLRESRAREITAFYDSISNAADRADPQLGGDHRQKDFSAAFKDLQKTPLPPGAQETVAKYYADVFGPELAKGTGQTADPAAVSADVERPDLPAERSTPRRPRATSPRPPRSCRPVTPVPGRRQRPLPTVLLRLRRPVRLRRRLAARHRRQRRLHRRQGGRPRRQRLAAPTRPPNSPTRIRKAMRATSVDEVIMTDFQDYAPAYGFPPRGCSPRSATAAGSTACWHCS